MGVHKQNVKRGEAALTDLSGTFSLGSFIHLGNQGTRVIRACGREGKLPLRDHDTGGWMHDAAMSVTEDAQGNLSRA